MEHLNRLLKSVLASTSEIIKEQCANFFSVKSLWLFRYLPEINSFKTWEYYIVEPCLQVQYKKLAETILNQVIPESVGTLGKVYRGKNWFLELDTYGAKEGTVIEIDLTMEHQSVLFIPIEDYENSIISILLVSISPSDTFLEMIKDCSNDEETINNKTTEIKGLLSEPLEKNLIYEKLRFAYGYQRNNDIINNFRSSKLSDIDILSFSSEKYLRDFLIAPLINNQTFRIPVIEITGGSFNNKRIIAFSDSAYNIYENALKIDYIENKKIDLQLVGSKGLDIEEKGKVIKLEYSFYSDSSDIASDVISELENILNEQICEEVDILLKSKNKMVIDDDTILVIKKKFISEKLTQKCFDILSKDSYKKLPLAVSLKYEWDSQNVYDEFIYYNAFAVDDKRLLKPFEKEYRIFYDKNSQKIVEKQINKENLVILVRSDESHSPFNELVKEFINQRLLYYTILLEKQRAITEAQKSAKAAIMSRNMSHNLGSHVMSYLKHQLSSMAAILHEDSQVLFNVDDLLDETYGKGSKSENLDNSIQTPFLLGLGRFVGYIQERQDYIATIATDYIPYGAPVNLKDAVYDVLNPDLKYLRHGKQEEARNRPFNILLNYIIKSEGFSRENVEKPEIGSVKNKKDITFKFLTYDDNGEQRVFSGLDNKEIDEKGNEMEEENPALSKMRKVNFSLPGGLVGRQALFSIIENVMRNAAKHGRTSDLDGCLEFSLDVIPMSDFVKKEKEGRYQGVKIEERVEDKKWRDLYANSADNNLLYLLTVTDNLVYQDPGALFKRLREGLEEEYIDKTSDFRMKSTNKGLKEIRISAAWLRNETNEDNYYRYEDEVNDLSKKKAPLIGVEFTKSNHLRYMICIPREKIATIVTDGLDEKEIKLFNRLKRTMPDDWEIVNSDSINFKVHSRFIICSKDQYKSLRPKTSNRLMTWEPLNEKRRAELVSEPNDVKFIKDMKDLIWRRFYGIDDSSGTANLTPIYIWDKTAAKAHAEDKNLPDKMIKLFPSDIDTKTAEYVYRCHHSIEKEFNKYWEKKQSDGDYGSIEFIDEITGDNSSDRLIRREPLTKMWYYSHLYAMKKKVAIIDERIFKMLFDINEDVFKTPLKTVNGINEKLENAISSKEQADELIQEIIECCNGQLSREDLQVIDYFKNDQDWIELRNKLKECINNLTGNHKSDNHKGITYHEKGVEVFTVVSEKGDDDRFLIIGRVNNLSTNNGSEKHYGCSVGRVGTITCVDGRCEVNIEGWYKERFDYISIHQGILDKIYERFGFKDVNRSDEKDEEKIKEKNRRGKESVTRDIFDKFMKTKNGNSSAIEDYLPCFIIHSGRAKPSEEDMPQKQPFVQYAALEHAIQDCKFELVELLDYARYEE